MRFCATQSASSRWRKSSTWLVLALVARNTAAKAIASIAKATSDSSKVKPFWQDRGFRIEDRGKGLSLRGQEFVGRLMAVFQQARYPVKHSLRRCFCR